MRKRIVIGLLAAVVIGVVAFVVSQPKQGSVAWHKREYRTAMDRFMGQTFTARCKQLLGRVRSQWRWQLDAAEGHALAEKMDEHRAALIDLGYLVERTIAVSNDVRMLQSLYVAESQMPNEHRQFTWVADVESNAVTIIGRHKDFPQWEQMIRKVDTAVGRNMVSARPRN